MSRNKMQYVQTSKLDLNKIKRQSDGALVLTAGVFKVGDYEHLGFEVPLSGVNFNDLVIGRLELAEAEKMLDQFEGLPLVKEHRWIETLNDRKELGVGAAMANAVIDGNIGMTRIVITEPASIAQVEKGEYQELSIGFTYNLEDVRGKVDGVDFLIKDVELNHLALVKEGRAGKEARLYNHAKHKELNMAKVTIGGVEYDVPNEVAAHIAAGNPAQTGGETVEKAEYEKVKAENTRLTAQFDALQQKKTDDDSMAKAVEIAKAHAEFSADLSKFGVNFDKPIGGYERTAVMRDTLATAGYTVKADADDVYVQAMFDVAKEQVSQKPASAIAGFELKKQDAVAQNYGEIQASNEASKSYFLGKGE